MTAMSRATRAHKRIAHVLERVTGGRLYRWLGVFALASAIALVAGDIGMWPLRPDYDPVSGTISDLAAGPFSWIMDSAIIFLALGVLALAIGFIFRDDADGKSWLVRVSLVLLALTMLPLALFENYSRRNFEGLVLHPYLVTFMGVLVAVVLWFAPSKEERRRFFVDPRIFAGAWVLTAPFLDVVPDSIQGVYERFLMWMLAAAVAAGAWRLLKEPLRSAA